MKRDDILIAILAVALAALAVVGINLVVDSTRTGLIVRWPI